MDIVRLVEMKFLSVAEKILKVLDGGVDYLTFETALKKELDDLGCEVLREVLEALERKLFESKERKHNWVVERKKSLNKQAVLDILQEALERTEQPPRQRRIQDTMGYIKNNWDGIEASVKNPTVGCSAEGHVSHILSERLSSRPMAWSLEGAGNMPLLNGKNSLTRVALRGLSNQMVI